MTKFRCESYEIAWIVVSLELVKISLMIPSGALNGVDQQSGKQTDTVIGYSERVFPIPPPLTPHSRFPLPRCTLVAPTTLHLQLANTAVEP